MKGRKGISESSISFLNVRLFCITRWSVSLSSLVMMSIYLFTLTRLPTLTTSYFSSIVV